MGLAAVRAGLKTNLETISGLRASTVIGAPVNPPCAVVGQVELRYGLTMGGGFEGTAKVRVYASKADNAAGQAVLDNFCDPSGAGSIKAAIESDTTAGGSVDALHVTGLDAFGVYEVAGVDYLGAEFTVSLWSKGS
jgi:hypothetical protein